jgi:polysaccharide chain length determinant protein (PEP-CTERM system associated)
MLGHREMTMEDYAEMFKRRFWMILTAGVVFLGVGFGVTYVIPPQFVSQTLVLIEQQKVPENYVKPVVSEDLGQRLASMKEQILSRSRVQPIIERFNLFAGSNKTMDDRVDLTRKAISVTPIRSDQSHGTGGMPGFFISFMAQDARTAQQVCGEITSLFVSENLSAREQSAEGTTDFLKQQLADSKRNLDDQDAKLADFQRKYIGKLPEQTASNANTLQALTTQLDAATQSLSRTQQQVTFLEAMIAQQKHDLRLSEPATGVSVDDRRKELNTLIAQKQELSTLYTPDHPDLLALSRKIADMQAEIERVPAEPASEAAPVKGPETPQLQQLKAQLGAAQQSMAAAKQQQGRIEQQVRIYESRIESSPTVEEEYKQVTRDHETALQFYNTLLTKMNESSMATALEHRQQGEQFRVMDAPNLPDEPVFPNRIIFTSGGLAAGLFLGLLLAALLEYRDTSLRSEKDIWAFTKLPTLAIISHIDGLPKPMRLHGQPKSSTRKSRSRESVRG